MVSLIIQVILSLLFIGGSSDNQTVPVRFHYNDSADFAGSQAINLSGELQGRNYWIRMVHYKNGALSYKILNEQPFIVKDTILSIRISAEPLHIHEVSFTINGGENSIVEKAQVEDVLHSILLETYPTAPYFSSDTIPLTGYSSGALREELVDGVMQQSGSYCDVRNAKLPPKQWHEAFNMKEYIWFDLFFE